MKAIFTGTLAGGFSIKAVTDDASAEGVMRRLLADTGGDELGEAVEVCSPTDLDKAVQPDADGTFFISYGKSLSGGFSVYGPFAHDEDAEEFAEFNRDDDEEWELLEFVPAPAPVLVPA